MAKHNWLLLAGEGLEFIENLAWCPLCSTVRIFSAVEGGRRIYCYWYPGMEITESVPEEDPGCQSILRTEVTTDYDPDRDHWHLGIRSQRGVMTLHTETAGGEKGKARVELAAASLRNILGHSRG